MGRRQRRQFCPRAHPWDVTPAEAREIQEGLRGAVVATDAFDGPRTVAGVDVGFERDGRTTRAAVVVVDYPTLKPIDEALVREPTRFPYVPGLLSFREAPAVLAALERLRRAPDMLVCDGHGLAHPRRFGIACHLGVLSEIPSIGVAKSLFVGAHGPLRNEKGARTPLLDGDEIIGAVLRSREGVRPIYVSVGHRVGLESAVRIVLGCLTRFRLPETTRLADRLASRRKR